MVASQKAPSIDYKVVKAQVAEQKFLQRMLDDRAGSVTNMQEIGKDITDSGAGAQQARPDVHVQEQVTDLVSRWSKIQQSADNRNQALESTMVAAKEFHDQLEPFLEWLESAEKEAQAQEVISTEPDRIAMQIKPPAETQRRRSRTPTRSEVPPRHRQRSTQTQLRGGSREPISASTQRR